MRWEYRCNFYSVACQGYELHLVGGVIAVDMDFRADITGLEGFGWNVFGEHDTVVSVDYG
ncbi:MAG: hypothetical protein SGI88_01825 [Candidatus Hydrogenedentes bacterium]|nr:hypothetical protein [Candidatus Hydrogenedentota bacterium]